MRLFACRWLIGPLSLALVLTMSADGVARGPRGGAGRGAAGAARSLTPSARPTGGFSGGASAPRSLPATTQQALGGRAKPVNPAQAQQWLGSGGQAAARGAASARYGQSAQAAATHLPSSPQAFSPAWYAQHPNAWQATHPHADAAVVATAAGVTAWLAGQPAGASYPVESSSDTTVVYTNVEEQADDPVGSVAPTSVDDEWLSLGVFELKPQPGAAATQFVQLSIDRDARLRGVFDDQITGVTQNVRGVVDQASGDASWSLEGSPGVVFATTLDALTQGWGSVSVMLPSGRQNWRLDRQAAP
ncbi:hypothetical protein Pla108_16610 [Botrimarina colliarenosi]|uniref:Uncharacterized protein n=1 Tax=Botrimarina colliarenosi TaxID=2528001 RepID=A0A5C6AN70_9BACT|nr:hypothetical protein [Botrimarina colliarenosi]TWU00709.1 hypothetical protein Pla108_16610 [Botrimarina colliarenosi]